MVPEFQKQGIGGDLLHYGHELGRCEGYAFAFLLGHSSYYPRYGYRTATHGFSKIARAVDALPAPDIEVDARPVQPADLPWLAERLAAELADVDLGVVEAVIAAPAPAAVSGRTASNRTAG